MEIGRVGKRNSKVATGARELASAPARAYLCRDSKALFSSRKFLGFATVTLSFLFDNHCPIMYSKDSSHKLQINCAINYIFLFIFNVSYMYRKIQHNEES
jgi:hypothetical protein